MNRFVKLFLSSIFLLSVLSQSALAQTPRYIGVRVFHDANGDGIRQAGEPFIHGIHISVLWKFAGYPWNEAPMVTTDVNGYAWPLQSLQSPGVAVTAVVEPILPNRCWIWQGNPNTDSVSITIPAGVSYTQYLGVNNNSSGCAG